VTERLAIVLIVF